MTALSRRNGAGRTVVLPVSIILTLSSSLGSFPLRMLAADVLHPATAAYSNFCYHEESGDVLGVRIVLVRFVEDSYVVFQLAEGWFAPPQLVPAEIGEQTLEFVVPGHPPLDFKGRWSDAEVVGSFEGSNLETTSGSKVFHLPVLKDDDSLPDCPYP